MKVGDRVELVVKEGSRYHGRVGTVEQVKWGKGAKHPHYGVRVDGDEGTVWGERLPFFDHDEVRPTNPEREDQ